MPQRPIKDKILVEIVKLHDRGGLGFREIGPRLGISHTRAHVLYKRKKAEMAELVAAKEPVKVKPVPRPRPKPAPKPKPKESIYEDAPPKEEIPLVPVEDAEMPVYQPPPEHVLDPSCPTVPRGVILEDAKLADKMNHLVQRLLAITEGEADIVIGDMTGPQRIEAAAKMIDKMRLLRNQSTENVNTHTFVDLISKLTASLRKGKQKKLPKAKAKTTPENPSLPEFLQ